MSRKSRKIIVGGLSALSLSGLGVLDLQAAVINSASGNVTARGEDGVPWELYENGFLLFKPVAGKDHLVKGSWQNQKDKITGIGFSGKVYAPEDSSDLFKDFVNMTYFDGAKFDVRNVSNMKGMFSASSGKDMILESVDFSNWETEVVRDMSYMFANNTKLKHLDLHSWKLLNLRTMEKMFAHDHNNSGLESLNISNWKYNFADVNTSNMFSGNSHLWKISLPYVFILDYDNLGLSRNINKSTDKWKREDGKFQPYTWSELGRNWTPAMSGTWVREPSTHAIEISFEMGTHPVIPKINGVYTLNTDPKIKDDFIANFTLPTPKNPENLRFIGWGGSTGGPQDNNKLIHALYFFTDIGKATLYPKWEVIPKEPKTVTEVIEPTKEYVIDETRDKGAKNLEAPGKKGSKTTKITYTIHPETGVATENRGEPVIDSAGKTVVKVAAKPETRQVIGNDGNKYEETTRYTINASNGDLTPNSTRRLVENTKAIEAINAEARKKNDEIETANITQEAKTRLKAKVEGERTKGIDAVKKMDTVEKGNAERDKAITAIRAISLDADKKGKEAQDLQKAKDTGIDAIKKAAEDKKVEINTADLLPEAKTKLLAKVEEEKNKGIEAVGKANNLRSVESESTKAVGIIKAISLEADKEAKKVQDARSSAIDAIKRAAKEKIDEIERANILPEAKTRLKNQVESEKNKGIDAVGKAINVVGINSERDKAVEIIRGIGLDADIRNKIKVDNENAVNTSKNDAINVIKKGATEKLAEIEKADILPADKDVLKTRVNTERDNGITDINKLTEIPEINKKRDLVVKTIRKIDLSSFKKAKAEKDLADAKKLGVEAIEKAARDKISEIENADLLPIDKEKLKGQVNAEKTKGIDAVNKATTVSGAKSESDKVVGIIKAISLDAGKRAKAEKELADAKKLGVEAIEKAARDKISEIENADLLPADKEKLKGQVNTEKTKGIDAVNKATTVSGAKSESDKAVGIIKDISLDAGKRTKAEKDLADAKKLGIEAIEKAARDKISEIESADLLPSDKEKLKGQVNAEKTKGIDAVNKATTVSGAKSESDKAVGIIKAISLDAGKRTKAEKDLADAKKLGIEAIEKAARDKISEIENADLLPIDKEKLKGQVNTEKTKGIDAVNKATTVSGAKSESDKVVGIIKAISLDAGKRAKAEKELADAKKLGVEAIEKAARDKISEIENADLLPADKEKLKGQVNTEKTKGIDAVNKATTVSGAKSESDKAVGIIKAISLDQAKKAKLDLDTTRRDAIKAVRDKGEEFLKDLERRNLDSKEKSKLKDKIIQIVDDAVKNIGEANRNQIDPLKNKAIKDLEDFIPEIKKLEQDKINRDNEELAKKTLDQLKADAKKKVTDEYNRIKDEVNKMDLDEAVKKYLLKGLDDFHKKGLGLIDGATKDDVLKIRDGVISDMNKVLDDANTRLRAKKEKEQLDLDKQKAKEKIKAEYEKQQNRIKVVNVSAKLKADLIRELVDRYGKGIADIDGSDRNRLGKVVDDTVRDLIRIADKAVDAEKAERERLERETLEKERSEKERLAREKAEKERLEKERLAREKAEAERLAKEKAEKERLAKEKAEKERLAREKAEAERLAREKAERERLEKERLERERLEKERLERERLEKERLAREKAEAERLAREKAEAERLAREKAEAERLAREKVEAERLALEKAEKERLEVERLAREKAEKERLERERLAKEEAERLAREKSERERLEKERLARENAERLAELEADRLAREKAEIERIAREVREKREKELVERNRLDHEKYLKDRLAREKTERLAKEKADAERLAKEEAERLAKEKAEADRLAKEKAEQERLAKERAERERLAKEDAERLAREKAEVDRLAREKAERVVKESIKPTIKQAKLPETGDRSMANYGLIGLVLALLTRFKRRKN